MKKKTPKMKNAEAFPPVSTTPRSGTPAGYFSNRAIITRNGGVRHQFLNDIGGCSANYR